MSGIVAEIEAEIGKLKSEVTKSHTGRVRKSATAWPRSRASPAWR